MDDFGNQKPLASFKMCVDSTDAPVQEFPSLSPSPLLDHQSSIIYHLSILFLPPFSIRLADPVPSIRHDADGGDNQECARRPATREVALELDGIWEAEASAVAVVAVVVGRDPQLVL